MRLPGPVCIDTPLTGRMVDYTHPGLCSAIDRRPVCDVVEVDINGIVGNEQSDLRVHSGPDKTIHYYLFDHYAVWQADIGVQPLLAQPGVFGGNISTTGIAEVDIRVGDHLCTGSMMLEVSQLHRPCWKLSGHFNAHGMARHVQHMARTGWYYRAPRGGMLYVGDTLEWLERPWP